MPLDKANKRLYIDRTNGYGITPQEVSLCIEDYRVDTNGNVDVGMMCSSPKVNKWSLNKPFIWAKWGYSIDATGDAEKATARAAVRQGLTAVTVSKILKASIGYTSFDASTQADGLAEVSEWGYNQPTGGASSPFRLPDFDGYEHDAVAPDSGWSQITFKDDVIDELMNATITVDGSGYTFKLTPSINDGLYSFFAMMFNQSSGVEIGETGKMEIAVSDIASVDGNYRLAMAVWIPNFGDSGGWGIFASRMTIAQYEGGAGDNIRVLFPDFATNPYAMYHIKRHYQDTNTKDFLAVPLLVKDLGFSYETVNEKQYFYLRAVGDDTQAYCMPSGQKDVNVYFDIVSANDVEGAEVVKFISPDGWYVGYRFSGSYSGTGTGSKGINTLFIGSVRPITEDTVVRLIGTVRYFPATTDATELTASIDTGELTVSAGAQVIINGKAYNGIFVQQRPALYMKEEDVTNFLINPS